MQNNTHSPFFSSQSLSKFIKKIEPKWAVKTGLAAGLAFLTGNWLSKILNEPGFSSLVGALWCVVSAIMVSQARIGGSVKAGWNRFLGSGIGSFLGAVSVLTLGTNLFTLALSVALVVMILLALNLRPAIGLTGITLAVVMILWKINPEVGPWFFALFRFTDTCIGIFFAFLVSMVVWPEKASKKLHLNMAKILSSIHGYYRFITLESSYSANMESLADEIEQALKKNLFFLEEAKMELLINRKKNEIWLALHSKLDQMMDMLKFLKKIEKNQREEVNEKLGVSLNDLFVTVNSAFLEGILALQNYSPIKEQIEIEEAIKECEKKMTCAEKKGFEKNCRLIALGNFFAFF